MVPRAGVGDSGYSEKPGAGVPGYSGVPANTGAPGMEWMCSPDVHRGDI